jgi:hypothetical protein
VIELGKPAVVDGEVVAVFVKVDVTAAGADVEIIGVVVVVELDVAFGLNAEVVGTAIEFDEEFRVDVGVVDAVVEFDVVLTVDAELIGVFVELDESVV